MKHLYRSQENKTFLGILGGLGEYWDIDPVILRVFFVVGVLLTGIVPLVVAYFIASFIMPKH